VLFSILESHFNTAPHYSSYQYGDTRGNVTFADGHAGFIRFIYESGVRNMSGSDYTFDRTK